MVFWEDNPFYGAIFSSSDQSTHERTEKGLPHSVLWAGVVDATWSRLPAVHEGGTI